MAAVSSWMGSPQRPQVALPAATSGAMALRRSWWLWPQPPRVLAPGWLASTLPVHYRVAWEWEEPEPLARLDGTRSPCGDEQRPRISGALSFSGHGSQLGRSGRWRCCLLKKRGHAAVLCLRPVRM